jgi:hypothetical protein
MGNILWLASYPKSGNTWLRAFLHNLLLDPDEPVDINRMASLTKGDSQAIWYQPLDPRPPGALDQKTLAKLRPKAHRLIADSGKDTVFVKTHNALVMVADVPMITLNVTAGAIYVVRNPLDVALSYADHLGLSYDDVITLMGETGFETPASDHLIPEHHSDWSSHVKSWTQIPNPALLVLRYEDLLAAPEQEFGKVARFLGLGADDARIARAVRFSSFDALRGQEDRAGFIERTPVQRRFFRSGQAGGWKARLSAAEVRRLTTRHREQMARFRYLPDGA